MWLFIAVVGVLHQQQLISVSKKKEVVLDWCNIDGTSIYKNTFSPQRHRDIIKN